MNGIASHLCVCTMAGIVVGCSKEVKGSEFGVQDSACQIALLPFLNPKLRTLMPPLPFP
jgi:hypothetical protein